MYIRDVSECVRAGTANERDLSVRRVRRLKVVVSLGSELSRIRSVNV